MRKPFGRVTKLMRKLGRPSYIIKQCEQHGCVNKVALLCCYSILWSH